VDLLSWKKWSFFQFLRGCPSRHPKGPSGLEKRLSLPVIGLQRLYVSDGTVTELGRMEAIRAVVPAAGDPPSTCDPWGVRTDGIHRLIAAGVKRERKRRGWTQEDLGSALRGAGLASWRTSTVGGVEAGMRFPALDELLMICAALGTGLAELIPAGDRRLASRQGCTSRHLRSAR
jgi:hypothetical protein